MTIAKKPRVVSGARPLLGHMVEFLREPEALIERGYREQCCSRRTRIVCTGRDGNCRVSVGSHGNGRAGSYELARGADDLHDVLATFEIAEGETAGLVGLYPRHQLARLDVS